MPEQPESAHQSNAAGQPDTAFVRDDDFAALYANNFQFEPSVWDLKMIFGQLDQPNAGSVVVEQHTAMTMAWPAAKIAAYYLSVNVIVHQARNGAIQIPLPAMPARPDPNDPTLDEAGRKLVDYLAWVHDQFFSDHPYTPPSLTRDAEPA